MRFYQVHHWDIQDSSRGFRYFTSRKRAEAENRKLGTHRDIEVIEIEPTKAGILRALNVYGGHPDNG